MIIVEMNQEEIGHITMVSLMDVCQSKAILEMCVNLRLMDKVFGIMENLRAKIQIRRNQCNIDYSLPINCNF